MAALEATAEPELQPVPAPVAAEAPRADTVSAAPARSEFCGRIASVAQSAHNQFRTTLPSRHTFPPAYPHPIGSPPPPPCIRGADWLPPPPASPLPSNAAMAAPTKKAAAMAEPDAEAAAALSELTALLSPSSPAAPEAAEAALALSGSPSGRALLAEHPAALSALSAMAASASRGSRPALAALVNASSEPAALEPLLPAVPSLVPLLPSSGAACGVLANLSRAAEAAPRVLQALGPDAEVALLRALSAERPPAELGALLCNLSQAPRGRRALLEPTGRILRRLLALLRCPEPELRRGAAGALRNCCFQHEHHERLLSPEVDALPALLLPLAGPEELPEEEMEQLPLDLQYLPPEHQREEEPEIRKMLLETLMLLAATGAGRAQLRARGSYLVLRELHSWERHPEVLSACLKVIQVLIGDEPQAGLENLLEVTIPEELEQHLSDLDRREQEEHAREGTGTDR